ncbi:hypothetical protein R3P38DRAFT_3195718 [Favolaschia claudopus]|uniref:NB-ARC domain-containing protein n=1 Tax=Favolaschia claudopus TaxID=2862362 RepID=A0AAW0B9R8_9AGAR
MVGCLPWHRRRGASEAKNQMEVDVVDVGSRLDGENQTIPTTAMYSITGGKALAEAIEGVADLVPLPFLSTFVGMAIKVLEACEETTTIEENIKDLQSRVYNLMLVVVDTAVNKKTSLDLQDKISKLQAILDNILADVRKIKEQKKWLLFFFRDLNKDRVERCVDRLNAALQQFNARFSFALCHVGKLIFSQVASQLRVEDLLDKIKADYSAFATQLNRIEDAVNRTIRPHNAPSAYPRQDMPPLAQKLYGRESLIDEIATLLASEDTSRVCITGAGGMGKTSVALAVVDSPTIKNAFPKEFIFWVPCVEAKSSDLIRRILYAQLRVTAETYDSLETLIAELDATKERRLILLDNFETPWLRLSGEEKDKVAIILHSLAKLSHIALLVTMTSGFTPGDINWEHRPLSPLDSSAASAAFKSRYRYAAGGRELVHEEPQLEEFLTSIGRIPLAITLAATSGGHLRASPSDLLQDWSRSGTGMMSDHEEETAGMNRTIRLSLDNSSMKSNPEAFKLLAILSLLPAGTIGTNLDRWAVVLTSPRAAVETLRVAALVEQGDGMFGQARIFVHPTIQSYMLHHGHLSHEVRDTVYDACYSFVLDHKSTPDDRKFKSDLEALAGEEMNIQGLLMETDVLTPRSPKAIHALIAFAFYQASTKPSTVVASLALKVAQAAYDSGLASHCEAAPYLAEAQHCLGRNYFLLDRFEEASLHFEEARSGFKGLPGGGDLARSGECSWELLRTWTYMQTKHVNDLQPLVVEAQANLAHDANDKYSVARGLLCYGFFLWWASLLPFSRTYAWFGEYDTALTVARKAVDKAEQSGSVELLIRSLETTVRRLMNLQRHEEAMDVITRLLPIAQAAGTSLGLAQTLELFGYTCVATCDLVGARRAYDGARLHFSRMQCCEMSDNGVARCSRNLEKLKWLTAIDEDCLGIIETRSMVLICIRRTYPSLYS